MKFFLILFLLIPCSLFAQKLLDDGTDRIRIVETDKIVQAEIIPVENDPGINNNLYYFWYAANEIHSTQGGFSGKLLNGTYVEYYKNKSLETQGAFKEGLKNGIWKSWNIDGSLIQAENWKKGILIPPDPRTFLQKLNIFRKRKRQVLKTDTVKSK